MTKKCIVCKAEANPTCDRSYHYFPKDDSLRQQWIEALKLHPPINFKTAFVCSLHFDSKCYNDRDQRARYRLLTGSIPALDSNTRILQTVAQDNYNYDQKDEINKQEFHLDSSSGCCININTCKKSNNSVENVNDTIIALTTKSDNKNTPQVIPNMIVDKKRKNCVLNNSNNKKVKFTHDNEIKYLSREDFISNESWKKFLEFRAYSRLKLVAAHNRKSRKVKKIMTLSNLISNLTKKEEFSAANYLKDLPIHLQELLERIKKNKKTAIFSPNLKNFARSLHFHSHFHAHNINVSSITFDGDKAHKTACEFLGANLDYSHKEKFKPYFSHPQTGKPVLIFYDPCHCINLCRNYFACKGPLIDKESKYIQWSFIEKLHMKQQQEKLHCATKIKTRHINFQNEKMRVFLAVQILSNSTSIALNFLEFHLKDKNFMGASATSNFCKNLNDIFDLLNIRNKFCKTPGRSAITLEMPSSLKINVDKFILYIENLKILQNVKTSKENLDPKSNNKILIKVIESPAVRTGFLGLIICLTN